MELLFQKYPLKLGDLGSGFYFERAYFTNQLILYQLSKTNSKVKKVYGEFQIEIKYNKW